MSEDMKKLKTRNKESCEPLKATQQKMCWKRKNRREKGEEISLWQALHPARERVRW
jgi:hypothetical protein